MNANEATKTLRQQTEAHPASVFLLATVLTLSRRFLTTDKIRDLCLYLRVLNILRLKYRTNFVQLK